MSKYIDAVRLKAEIEKNTPNHLMLMVYRDHILALIDSFQQEQPEVDLEDEMEKFGEHWPYPASFDGYDKDWVDELTEECAKHFYELGKKDMKEQMLKEAVEGYVNYYEDSGGILMAEAQVGCPYHNGDKVKIIIVKEDEK